MWSCFFIIFFLSVKDVKADYDTKVLYSFENWIISEVPRNKLYILRGNSTGKNYGYFEYHCFQGSNQETVLFPILQNDKSQKQQNFYVWNDKARPVNLEFLNFKNTLAIALYYTDRKKIQDAIRMKDYNTMSAWMFVETLRTSESEFGLGQGVKSLTFDTKHLNTALTTFSELCRRP